MELYTLILIALGLSMDSFAVSVSNGIAFPSLKRITLLAIAFSFAFFQGLLPALGWVLGNGFRVYIESIDHWIAFVLLAIIGGKMIYESFSDEEDGSSLKTLGFMTVIMQSIATSIDAFAVGISLSVLQVNIVVAVLLISLVTALFSLLGLKMGRAIGTKIGHKAELFGGIVLLGLGIKIFVEHTYF